MKKLFKFLSCMLAVAFVLTACTGKTDTGRAVTDSPVKDGIYADKVIFLVSTDETIALKDVVEGKADLLYTQASPSILRKLSDADRDKIDIYPVPSGYWSLFFNPIPNKAPYTWKSETAEEETFNPFAIKEIRFAFNWIMDRKKLVDEILFGEGAPMYTPCISGLPGTYRYNLLPAQFGITDTGDEQKALDMIKTAMEKAAELPELKGLLVFENGKWMYKGKPVTVKSILRTDDPTRRLPAARYINAQFEKAGITVEGVERDRMTAGQLVYGGNPADLDWHLYLEGWGSGGTSKYHEGALSQMYAPFYGYMPGAMEGSYWNYENGKLDEYGKKAVYGQYLTGDEYWKETVEMCSLGIQEAVRVYICSQNDLYVANKARFGSRLFYGLGDGFNGWTIRCADVKPDTDGPYKGQRVVRVMQFSAKGSLFMSQWDVIGGQGFSDTYSSAFYRLLSDGNSYIDNPCTADLEDFFCKVDTASYKADPKLVATGKKTDEGDDEYEMGGNIPVSADAVLYNSDKKAWEKVGAGLTSACTATGKTVDGYYWHNGEPCDIYDVRYALAFPREWGMQNGEDDQYYDSNLGAFYEPGFKTEKGYVFNADGSITAFTNVFTAYDSDMSAKVAGGVSAKAANPGRYTSVPWEIYEACSEMVVTGSKSGTIYNFAKDGGGRGVEVHVIGVECVADIKAKLEELAEKKHIPHSLKGFITEDYAVKRYKASIAFIEKYGHAYISNGPCMIEKIDTVTNSVIIDAVDKYPYKSNYFPNLFINDMTTINYVKAPAAQSADKDAVYEITVAKYTYPNVEQTPLSDGVVEAKLQLPGGKEQAYTAVRKEAGKYTLTIPAADLAKLEKGVDYTVVIFSSIAKEPPATKSVKLSLLK